MCQYQMQRFHYEKFTNNFNFWKRIKFANLSFNGLTIIVFLTFKIVNAIYRRLFPDKINDDFIWNEQKNETFKHEDDGSRERDSIRPFRINIQDGIINQLKLRLEGTRYEEPLHNSGFEYGFNSSCLRKVMEYWKTQYDWRKHEKELNIYPHFMTNIDGLNLHFLHAKPSLTGNKKLKVIPLLLIHGWPGSCSSFNKLIPFLIHTDNGQDLVFEVVCPSIPGFGFSQAPRHQGINGNDAALMFLTLMDRLGFSRFYVQGCGWGAVVASLMGRFCPKRVQGVHVNMCFSLPKSFDSFIRLTLLTVFPFLISPLERRAILPLKKKLQTLWNETGYGHIQGSKPDTLGCAMADSPAGMAAYFLEKMLNLNPENSLLRDDELLEKSKLDEVLTMATICWANNNFTSSARFYKDNLKDVINGVHERFPLTVPVGVAFLPNEVLMLPKMIMQQQIEDLVSYTIMPERTQPQVMEQSQFLANEVRKFIRLVENR